MARSTPQPEPPDSTPASARLLSFVYLGSFLDDWADLGPSETDLEALERVLLDRPEAGAVVPGTGGLRKLRFAPAESGKGKRGSERVCYALFPRPGLVLMVAVYGKSDKDDLSPAERAAIKALLGRFGAQLNHPTRGGGRA